LYVSDDILGGKGKMDNQLSIVEKLVKKIIVEAVRRDANFIHIEAKTSVIVRFVIGSILYDVSHLPLKMREDFMTSIKSKLKFDVTQKETPQSHQITLKVLCDRRWRAVIHQVSLLPTTSSEEIILNCISSRAL
jgi:type II secretory ATPase GspE/PulE/Tfp pilus assembly ATPase PilB-like protein